LLEQNKVQIQITKFHFLVKKQKFLVKKLLKFLEE